MRFQLKGLQDSRVNKQIQLSSLREQMNSMKQLAADGYLPRNRYLEVQRQFAEVNSSIDETVGRIGQVQKQLQESQQRIDQRFADYQREVRTNWRKRRWTPVNSETSWKWRILISATPLSPRRWMAP
jgi:membrane fusion protein, protease secretion system